MNRILPIVVPTNARGAFLRGTGLSLVLGMILVSVICPVTGLGDVFGGKTNDGYWQIAWNVSRGNGFVFSPGGRPELHRPPVVPLLFAPLTFLPAFSQQAGLVLLHSVLIGAICYFLFDLAERIAGPKTGGVAVGILLLYPWLYWHAKNPMCVIAQMLGVMFLLDLMASEFLQPERPVLAIGPFSRAPGRWILTGAVAAMLALTHGTALPAIVFLLLVVFVVGIVRRNRHWVLAAVIPAAVATILIAPWTYRNWKVTHRFVPIVHSLGYTYFLGNAHWGFGLESDAPPPPGIAVFAAAHLPDSADTVQYFGVTDVETANALSGQVINDIKSHPGQLLAKTSLNAMEFFFPVVYDVFSGRAGPLNTFDAFKSLAVSIVNLAIWVLAFVGLWKTKEKAARLSQILVLLCVCVLCLPYFPVIAFIDHAQYSAPLVPLLAILAAGGILALWPARFATN